MDGSTRHAAIALANAFEREGYPASVCSYRGRDTVLVYTRDTRRRVPPLQEDVDPRDDIPNERDGVWCRVSWHGRRKGLVCDVAYRSGVPGQELLAQTLPESVADAVLGLDDVHGIVLSAGTGSELARISLMLAEVERARRSRIEGDALPFVSRLHEHMRDNGVAPALN